MSNIAFLFLPLAFSSLPAVLPFVSPSSQVLYSFTKCVKVGDFYISQPVATTFLCSAVRCGVFFTNPVGVRGPRGRAGGADVEAICVEACRGQVVR